MAQKMLQYISSQPELWKHLIESRQQITAPFVEAFSACKPSHLLMIGSGSSYNAALCVQRLFARLLGIRVTPCVPTRVEDCLPLFAPEQTIAMVISQSGESTSTIGVLNTLKEKGYPTVGLTQVLTSTIARESDVLIDLACGEESVGPKTKGFTATVLVLQLLALALAHGLGLSAQADAVLEDLHQALICAPRIIEESIAWCRGAGSQLATAPHVLLIADGDNHSAMAEGALKLLETLYVPCMHYEFEEYLHGVQCTIAPGSHLVFIIPDNHNRERMLKLAAFNRAHGGVSYIITTGKPAGVEGELFLSTANSPWTSCYDVLLPTQVISALVSEAKGINCDVSKFPTFIKDLGTKNW